MRKYRLNTSIYPSIRLCYKIVVPKGPVSCLSALKVYLPRAHWSRHNLRRKMADNGKGKYSTPNAIYPKWFSVNCPILVNRHEVWLTWKRRKLYNSKKQTASFWKRMVNFRENILLTYKTLMQLSERPYKNFSNKDCRGKIIFTSQIKTSNFYFAWSPKERRLTNR